MPMAMIPGASWTLLSFMLSFMQLVLPAPEADTRFIKMVLLSKWSCQTHPRARSSLSLPPLSRNPPLLHFEIETVSSGISDTMVEGTRLVKHRRAIENDLTCKFNDQIK